MIVYPYSTPIIMTPAIYAAYGGKISSFSAEQLSFAMQIAEQQTSNYIGTFLLPTVVTGTYGTVPVTTQRIATDYGYVSQILNVIVKTQKITHAGTELLNVPGGAFIYQDTFGYIDIYKLLSVYGISYYPTDLSPFNGYLPYQANIPYQFQVAYEAGLPTGTANLPGMLAAMTLATSITLNELFPGVAGMNEGVGDVGIQEYESFGYHERRTAHSLRRTAFGGSALASKVASLIDATVKKARKSLRL